MPSIGQYIKLDTSDVTTALSQQDKLSYQLFVYLFNDSSYFLMITSVSPHSSTSLLCIHSNRLYTPDMLYIHAVIVCAVSADTYCFGWKLIVPQLVK